LACTYFCLLFWRLSPAAQNSGLLLLLQGHVEVSQLDLADLSSVHRLAKQLSSEPSIDVLFLNAGVMACPQSYTKNGFEMQIGTNHFGHFELTHLLMDKFRQQVMHKFQNLGIMHLHSLHSC
jgi:NAD(P)-dependent dehydrogenase (short-subunit alcohol dehydrogenase family)